MDNVFAVCYTKREDDMKYSEFSNGTKVIDGKDVLAELPTILIGLNASRVLLVANTFLHSQGYVDKVKKSIERHGSLKVSAVYLENRVEDNMSALKDMYFVYMSNSCDSIVVCGSGKLIDYAKALKLLVSTQVNDIERFYNPEAAVRQAIRVPLITVPSKFGIGNETNATAIVYDEKKGVSRNIINNILLPDYCIVDSENFARMDKKLIAYSVLEILARAIDGFTSKNSTNFAATDLISRMVDEVTGKTPASISEGFCRVALIELKSTALSMLESPNESKAVRLEMVSAYLSKGTDSCGLGLIHCTAQALSDVLKTEYCKVLPRAIRIAVKYNLDACKQKYAQCLLAFTGWDAYTFAPKDERHYEFARQVFEFIETLEKKYIKPAKEKEVDEEEKQAVLNHMVYNVHLLNNPQKFNIVNFKMAL